MSKKIFYTVATLIITTLVVPLDLFAQANDQFIVKNFIGVDDAPTIPNAVVATPLSPSAVSIAWTASIDDTGLAGYEVFRDSFFLATVTAPTTVYTDTGLSASTTYLYMVRAFDTGFQYSAFSTSSATTTPAAPVVVTPSTTPSGTRYGSKSSASQALTFTLTTTPQSDAIVLNLASGVPVRATVSWGRTSDGTIGTLTTPGYRPQLDTKITGLLPGTTYVITVRVEDEIGNVSTKTITVTTTNDTNDGSAPPNPSQFQGVGRATDIQLSWENPTVSDFSHVRIMRQSGTVPVDPYDGTIVYEGNLEQFLDQHAQSGTMYGYTIFAADEHGNFSSGVTVFVRSGEEATRPEYVFESSAESTTTIDFSQKITVTQGEYSAGAKGNTITITNDAPFTLSLPTETLPRVLKTILVTLRHPRNTTEFTFLLRANRKRTAYESTIDTLTEVGTYPATVTVLDVSSKVLMKDEFMLTVEKGSPAIVSKEMSPWVSLTARIALLLTLMLLVVYTIRRLWLIGRRRREKM